nr:MAG TPA: Protein of unknown function (DUF3624) [Caudoviricetes sp.]
MPVRCRRCHLDFLSALSALSGYWLYLCASFGLI